MIIKCVDLSTSIVLLNDKTEKIGKSSWIKSTLVILKSQLV